MSIECLMLFKELEGCLFPSRYMFLTQLLIRLPKIKLFQNSISPLMSIFFNSLFSNLKNVCSKNIQKKFKIRLMLKVLKNRSLILDNEKLSKILINGKISESETERLKISDQIIEYCNDPNFNPFLPFWQNPKVGL